MKLYFNFGKGLPDPKKLLRGSAKHARCGVRVDFSKSAIKGHSDPISHFLGFHGHSVRMSVEAAINAHPAPNNPARKLNQKTDLSETFVGSFIGHSS
ncbi:MAG: hypothetical protein ABL996_05800 [Micropepsaceae bacterium]